MRGEVEPVRLTIPFAVATGMGGWLTAAMVTGGDDFLVVGPIALAIFAVVGGLLGRGLARHPSLLALTLALPCLGGIVGAIAEAFLNGSPPATGAVVGVVLAIAHLPMLCLILLAARAARGVRERTCAHAAARRRVAVATAGPIAIAILGMLASRAFGHAEDANRHLTLELVATMALGTIAGCFLADVRDLRRLRKSAAAHDRARALPREEWHDITQADVVDFGVGNDEAVVLGPRATAYRDTASVVTHVRGTVEGAVRVLRGAIAADAFALTLTCVFFAVALSAEPSAIGGVGAGNLPLPPYDQGVTVLQRLAGDRPSGEDLARYADVPESKPLAVPAYYVDRDRAGKACLYHEGTDGDSLLIRCTPALPGGRLGVTLQSGERMAVLWSIDVGVLHYEWVQLESAVVVRTGAVLGVTGPGAIGASGTYVIPMEDASQSLEVIDLWTGKSGRILSSGGSFEVEPASHWRIADGGAETLVVARAFTDGRTFQIVAIDPRAVLR